MIVDVINNYYAVIQSIPKLIDASGFRNDFLASKLGIKPQTFSAKKNSGSWSKDELLKLAGIIESEEVEEVYMLEMMRLKKGEETMTVDELKEYLAQ